MNLMNMIRPRAKQKKPSRRPILSVVVVFFNMEREAKRTLCSLTPKYQEGVCEEDYEVILVDNGSSIPLSAEFIKSLGSNFKYHYVKKAASSPASAVNFGAEISHGEFLGVMIDGARILTPGVIKYALLALQMYKNPIVSTMGWHLGPDLQNRSISNGYNQEVEDKLLSSIDWPHHGYRLFEISSPAGSCRYGWFLSFAESNCLFMSRKTFKSLGGYDERFDYPGGGFVNLDMYHRACELADSRLIVILGEGSFHQIHGGVATNVSEERNLMLYKKWENQYLRIRKKNFSPPSKRPEYIGHVPPQSLKSIMQSAENAIKLTYSERS